MAGFGASGVSRTPVGVYDPYTVGSGAPPESIQALQEPAPVAPAPVAGPSAFVKDPSSGATTPYTPNPFMVTNQYQTDPLTGTAVSGKGSLTQPSYEVQQQTQLSSTLGDKSTAEKMNLAAKLQADAEARRLGYLSTVTGQHPQVAGGNIAADETAARAAAFARAKEQAGNTANASLKALGDVMAGRGMTGSSVEGSAIADIVGGAQGGVNEFTREQLIQDLNRAAGISDRNYQGAVTQRGQDLSMVPSLMGLITASGGLY